MYENENPLAKVAKRLFTLFLVIQGQVNTLYICQFWSAGSLNYARARGKQYSHASNFRVLLDESVMYRDARFTFDPHILRGMMSARAFLCTSNWHNRARKNPGTGKPCKTLIQYKGMSNSDVQVLVSSADDIGASSSSSGIQYTQFRQYTIS